MAVAQVQLDFPEVGRAAVGPAPAAAEAGRRVRHVIAVGEYCSAQTLFPSDGIGLDRDVVGYIRVA